jgi:hypothetical protein
MKKTKTLLLAITGAALFAAPQSQALTFNYARLGNATVQFTGGGQFQFGDDSTSVGTANISASGGDLGATPFFGSLYGIFTIGPITAIGPTSSASVSGLGTFTLVDAAAIPFTATVDWLDISQTGTGSTLNIQGFANMTSPSYAGTNPALLHLANNPGAISLGFTFVPPLGLSQIAVGGFQTSFSGTVFASGTPPNRGTSGVPEGGATAALMGLSLLVLGVAHQARNYWQ